MLALTAGFSLLPVVVTARTFRTLYSFTGGSDGNSPWSGLVLSSNTLYGTASSGGLNYGTVFALDTQGASFTNLHSFNGGDDRGNPRAALIVSGNTLYGTALYGGPLSWL